jgi:hypothetical protein
MTEPATAPLNTVDQFEHISGYPSGYGNAEAVRFLSDRASHAKITIFTGYDMFIYQVYLARNPNITLIDWNSFRNDTISSHFTHLGNVYVVFSVGSDGEGLSEQTLRESFVLKNPGAQLVATFPKPNTQLGYDEQVLLYYLFVP